MSEDGLARLSLRFVFDHTRYLKGAPPYDDANIRRKYRHNL